VPVKELWKSVNNWRRYGQKWHIFYGAWCKKHSQLVHGISLVQQMKKPTNHWDERKWCLVRLSAAAMSGSVGSWSCWPGWLPASERCLHWHKLLNDHTTNS